MSLLTDRWERLRTIEIQQAYWNSPHRFNVVPAGRRSGKTELAKRKTIKRAFRGTKFFPARFFLGAPTFNQAKRIFWDDLKSMIPRQFLAPGGISETDLRVRLITGSEIYVVGLDKPERMEGVPWDGGVLDEYGNMKPKAWTANVRPALSDRNGWCDLIGVPEGRNHYYDLNNQALADMHELGDLSEWGSFTWPSSLVLPAAEIAAAKRDLDELTYLQEYEASFVNFTGRAYYTFGAHNQQHLAYDPKQPLIFCFDFNVAPGVAVVAQEQKLPGIYKEVMINGVIRKEQVIGTGFIGEVWIPNNSNTPAVCRKLIADWGKHEGPVLCYGDATGGARGSAKVQGSDWDLIKENLTAHFGNRVKYKVPPANPAERARVNAMNARCMTMDGTVNMMVDPKKCPHMVKDLEGVRVLEGGSGEIDKNFSSELTHISDAGGYYIVAEFPTTKVKSKVRTLSGS